MSSFAMPDSPLLFCWAATVYCMLLAITHDDGRYWLVAGICLGLALLAKYMAIFLVPSTALFMIISGRRWLRRREPYLAMAIALLIFSPNLWWNMRHGWVTIVFQLHHGSTQAATDANPLQAAGFYLLAQMGCVGPLLAPLLGCGTIMALQSGLRRRQESQVLLACCTLVISGFFLLVHGLVYWGAPAYFTAIVCTSPWLASVLRTTTPARRMVLGLYCALALLCGCTESAYSVRMLIDGGLVPAAAAKIDPILVERQFPWPAVGRSLAATMSALRPAQRRTVILMADRYETAGEVAFYTPGHPKVYSGSHQYTLWGPPLAVPGGVVFIGNIYRLGDARTPIRRHARILADLSIRSGDHLRYLQITLFPDVTSHEAAAVVTTLMARTAVCACSFWHWS